MNTKEKFEMSLYEVLTYLDEEHEVYLVKHKLTDKIYVKKILKHYNLLVLQQLKEIKHSHIPKVYEFYVEENKCHVIEEFINGFTLDELLENRGPFTSDEVKQIIEPIMRTLDYLHSLKIVHKDIKCSNVMMSNDRIIKLIDFDASRVYDDVKSKDTFFMGTAGYAAPEHYGFSQTDARSDIYSLGVLMNFLLTGHSLQEGIYQGDERVIINKCTIIEPNNRFQSIKGLYYAYMNKKLPNYEGDQKGDYVSGRYSFPIPGFRSGNVAKSILAICGYLVIFGVWIGIEVDRKGIQGIVERFTICSIFMVPVILYTNYLDIRKFFPLTKHKNVIIRILACMFYSFIIALIFMLVNVIVNPVVI